MSPELWVQNCKAQLIGVICQIGSSTNSEHYTFAIKVKNIWYHCNDKVVTVVYFNDICDCNDSYMFMYHNGVYTSRFQYFEVVSGIWSTYPLGH